MAWGVLQWGCAKIDQNNRMKPSPYIIQHGERDKGNLKQLRWIHRNINRDGSPIHGWNGKLVQKALGSLANGGTMAAVISRYDLTIDAVEPDVLEHIEKIIPHL